ncbi:transposable element Tcb1 transposase [Trichonephila clavipes]|nr:transposable element Tcb1 transposase [Trichonephila clavipes]
MASDHSLPQAKVGNILGSLQVPRDWDHSGQSFPWLSRTLRFLGHGRIFNNVCGDNVLCSSEGQEDIKLSQLSSFIAEGPNMTWTYSFDQVSQFDRGSIVAYRDCGLSFRKIGSRVGRNQTTVMRICDRWIQEGTTDRHGPLHPPQGTTSRKDRQIKRMAVTDHSVTSRNVAQNFASVRYHSVFARTIRRRLQQSGLSTRRLLLGLPLTQNH